MKIVESYKVLEYLNTRHLTEEVNSLITEGWQPLGPAFKLGNITIAQTMVKYSTHKERTELCA